MNCWGKPYRINLQWDRDQPTARQSLPPRPPDGPQSPPPCLHQDPLRERNQHQEPARGPSGFSSEGSGEKIRPEVAPHDPQPVGAKSVPVLLAPKLADVTIEDLKDTGRLLDLLDQAIDRQLVGSSEADRLRFVAAAEHALAIGQGNPPGLFASLIRG